MKIFAIIFVCAVVLILSFPSLSLAEVNDTRDILFGALIGKITHEAGHQYIAGGKEEMSWHGSIINPRWEYKGRSGSYRTITKNGQPYRLYYDYDYYRQNLEIVTRAGIISEGMISHYINSKKINNKLLLNFRKGFVLGNIIGNVYQLTISRDRNDLDPNNFVNEEHRKTFKKFIAIDTGLLLYEFISKRSLLPKGTGISFSRRTIILKKSWSF